MEDNLDRLQSKGQKVLDYLNAHSGEELTLETISAATGVPSGSVASRIRDFRSFGHEILRRHIGAGIHGYTFLKAPTEPEIKAA